MYLLLYSINPLIATTTAVRSKNRSFLVRKKGLIGVCGQVIFGCGYRPRVLLMTFNLPADSPSHCLLHSCLPHPRSDTSQARTAKLWERLSHLHVLLSPVIGNFPAKLDFTLGGLLDFAFASVPCCFLRLPSVVSCHFYHTLPFAGREIDGTSGWRT